MMALVMDDAYNACRMWSTAAPERENRASRKLRGLP